MEKNNIEWNVSFNNKYKCPICNEIFYTNNFGIWIGYEEFAGIYCIKCLSKHISETIPKLIKIE